MYSPGLTHAHKLTHHPTASVPLKSYPLRPGRGCTANGCGNPRKKRAAGTAAKTNDAKWEKAAGVFLEQAKQPFRSPQVAVSLGQAPRDGGPFAFLFPKRVPTLSHDPRGDF